MKKILPILILLTSFNVSATIDPDTLPALSSGYWCYYNWITPTERTDGTPLYLYEIAGYEVTISGLPWLNEIDGSATHVLWYSAVPCPVCGELEISVIDTDGKPSAVVPDACPKPPVLCQ